MYGPIVIDAGEDDGLDLPGEMCKHCVCDVLKVPSSCGGNENRALLLLHLLSVGAPSWMSEPPHSCSDAADHNSHVHLRVFHFGSDKGPDQEKGDRLIQEDISNLGLHSSTTLHTRVFCFQHRQHLIVKRGLQLLERVLFNGYFSILAKTINCVRTSLNFRKLKQHYLDHHGVMLSSHVFKKLPQRPLRGRWGTATAAEEWLLAASSEHFPSSFEIEVVSKTVRARNFGDDAGADDGQYNGRWAKEAHIGLSSPRFWIVMEAAKASREPLNHFRHWLQSGSQSDRPHPKAVELSVVVADKILREWESFVGDRGFAQALLSKFNAIENVDDRQATTAGIVTLYLSQACDFSRTVASPCKRFPWLLAWIVYRPPNVMCEERRKFVVDLLAFADEQIDDPTSIKIRMIFGGDLEHIAKYGTVHAEFWQFMSSEVALMPPIHTFWLFGDRGRGDCETPVVNYFEPKLKGRFFECD